MNASYPRTTLLGLTVAAGLLAAVPAAAQETALPELGSSAGELITPQQEAQYGAYTLYQLRQMNLLLEDPLVEAWLQTMGHRLGASSDNPKQPYTFFMLRERQINAFATLGGYIGMNSGLVLTARSEDEVAGVLGHEISHVTQRHVVRSVERAKKEQIPIMLAALGMVIAAQSAGGDSASSDDATMAAVVGSQALMMQRQIDYTRANESEADRIGIQTLNRAGYDVDALGDFFARMESAGRANSGGYTAPDYLRTHPVTATRISEARDRAQKIKQETSTPSVGTRAGNNPLLPDFAQAHAARPGEGIGRDFPWVKERLRVLSAASPGAAITEYRRGVDGFESQPTDAQKYGLALAYIGHRQGGAAEALLGPLYTAHPDNLYIALARAEAAQVSANPALAQTRYEQLMRHYPGNRAVILSYAGFLLEQDDAAQARRAQDVLRRLAAGTGEDVVFQRTMARAYELSGNRLRAAEVYAEVSFLNGRVDDAIGQLAALLKNDELDYYQRARIEARIAEFTPISLELKRQGIKPEQQGG
ncbi:putative beta-barrel assembly-enhancing protease [Arenimonas maotaiensis]|uniref:Putative beta-barrel assembly-enhancing protease n=1 Tax=Arenimonas maotaiensis TaxID=1446479 RepID=A0A917CBV7_9GAMM|nr:M48 family metalloprotease [Arenimonas maotaiensis]GGF83586.1 putative beta-barrel assembly-enhancing protease [Arenimonas maotaiensis]